MKPCFFPGNGLVEDDYTAWRLVSETLKSHTGAEESDLPVRLNRPKVSPHSGNQSPTNQYTVEAAVSRDLFKVDPNFFGPRVNPYFDDDLPEPLAPLAPHPKPVTSTELEKDSPCISSQEGPELCIMGCGRPVYRDSRGYSNWYPRTCQSDWDKIKEDRAAALLRQNIVVATEVDSRVGVSEREVVAMEWARSDERSCCPAICMYM